MKVGEVPVEVEAKPFGALRIDRGAREALSVGSLATALGLDASDLDASLPAEAWSCGNTLPSCRCARARLLPRRGGA